MLSLGLDLSLGLEAKNWHPRPTGLGDQSLSLDAIAWMLRLWLC